MIACQQKVKKPSEAKPVSTLYPAAVIPELIITIDSVIIVIFAEWQLHA